MREQRAVPTWCLPCPESWRWLLRAGSEHGHSHELMSPCTEGGRRTAPFVISWVLIPLWRGRKRVQASLWSGKYTKCKLGKCACNRTFAMLYQIHSTTRCHPQHVKCNRWLLFIIWRVHVQHLLSMVTWPLLVKWGCATYGINQAASCFGRV